MSVLRQLFTIETVRNRYGHVTGYMVGYGIEALYVLVMAVCIAVLLGVRP